MDKNKRQKNNGFTIVEALVAILILTVSVVSMLGVTASSATSARYANNEITANYLLQEAVDSIRSNRDTLAFQKRDTAGFGWVPFLSKYGYPSSGCFDKTRGCDIKMEYFKPYLLSNSEIMNCTGLDCDALYYYDGSDANFFYSHDTGLGYSSNFKRTIVMEEIDSYQIKITATIKWKNGNSDKTQTLINYLLDWQK